MSTNTTADGIEALAIVRGLRARITELERDSARLTEYAFGMETALRAARASGTASETALWAAECAELRMVNSQLRARLEHPAQPTRASS